MTRRDTTKHGANHRPIETDDIASATRGLQLGSKLPSDLRALIQLHAPIDRFASAVIAVAAAEQLVEKQTMDWERFNDVELRAIRRSPSAVTRAGADYAMIELAQRAAEQARDAEADDAQTDVEG